MKPAKRLETGPPSPRVCVQNLAPYVPGRPIQEVEASFGIDGAVKLASNENPLGPSPRALEAARLALESVHRYPDSAGTDLRNALSARFGVAQERILLGAGGAELIDLVVRSFVEPGEEVVVPEGIFRMFPVAIGRSGGTVVTVPTRPDLKADLFAMKQRIGPQTKLVAIANPNNPTGSYVSRRELEEYFDGLPSHVLTILDEAYFEFADGLVADYPNGLEFLVAGHTVIVLRTFSKIAGLAGMRIGYGFAPEEIARTINKVREPFNTSSIAQAAAIGALEDEEHRQAVRELVRNERTFLVDELSSRGLPPRPSIANFFLVETPVPFQPLEPEFARRGVILRPMGGWGFPNAFRLSVGTRIENLKFLAALDELRELGLLLPVAADVPAAS
ncbi:MAG: histidinol-phosphate transaminase [Thermoanaerobaculia bacterium]